MNQPDDSHDETKAHSESTKAHTVSLDAVPDLTEHCVYSLGTVILILEAHDSTSTTSWHFVRGVHLDIPTTLLPSLLFVNARARVCVCVFRFVAVDVGVHNL